MKFKKYVKESRTLENKITLNEETFGADYNPDNHSFVSDEIDAIYKPVKDLIEKGEFDAAEKELNLLEDDLNELDVANSKKKFFRFPQFMIESQRKQLRALRAMLPKTESIEDMNNRCEKCNSLLNDGGTCPKCDDGEEDMRDSTDDINEELSVREKLKRAYPELNFDKPAVVEECTNEELSNKEKLLKAYPELNFNRVEEQTDEVLSEEMSAKEKLKKAFPELNFDSSVAESVEETAPQDYFDDIDDDYYDLDDVEQDRAHAALYGGDRMYCDCGKKLVMTEWGGYCPDCDPLDPEDAYKD